MKIIYVASPSLKNAHRIDQGLISAFQEEGIEVFSLRLLPHCQSELFNIIEEKDPDFIFCLFMKAEWDGFFSFFDNVSIPTIAWFYEDPHTIDYSKRHIHYFHFVFSSEKNAVPFYRELGHQSTFYLPHAFDPSLYFYEQHDKSIYQSDLCLVGDADEKRVSYIRYLYEHSDWKITVVGRGWTEALKDVKPSPRMQRVNYWVPARVARLFYSNSRIVLNLPYSNKRKTENEANIPCDSPSPSLFEIAGCKAFQIAERKKGINEQFHSAKTIVQVNSKEECLAIASHYMNEHDKRKLMAEAAYNEVICRHTYRQRMKNLLIAFAKTQ
ncbi:CgeB family protein [Alteribacter populi]|uniref:CgeB family protein n=1 Tax=Alteribacter populi TaxID=2011011 RepID=UPI000BBA9EEA|nr:glycosyltransferase [Alteribacter populi]